MNVPPPSRPQLAVSAGIMRDGRLLLVRRACAPAKGFYTFPGGRVEWGERLIQALIREVREETGLTVEPVALAGYREAIVPKPDGSVSAHFVILPFAARWIAGELALNEELDDARWIELHDLDRYRTTDGLTGVAEAVWALLSPA